MQHGLVPGQDTSCGGGRDRLPTADELGVLAFRLDRPTPLLNVLMRQGWQAARRDARTLAGLVRIATAGRRPAAPWERACIKVVRYGLRDADHDGVVGGLKSLIDCLLPPGAPYMVRRKGVVRWACKYPCGLSIIQDDGPQYLELVVTSVRVRSRDQQGTGVEIHKR